MCYAPDDKASPAVKYIRIGYMQNYESASKSEYMYQARCGDKWYRRNTMARLAKITKLSHESILRGMVSGKITENGKEWEIWLDKC